MARLLPNLHISPIVKPYRGSVAKEFDDAVSNKIQNYDLAAEQDDILMSQVDVLMENIASFGPDREAALKMIEKYNNQIKQRAESGDYENMVRQTRRDVRLFANEMAPLKARKEQFNKYVQEINSRDDLLDRQKKAAINAAVQMNETPSENGTLGNIKTVSPSSYVDATKLLDDRLRGMKADGRTTFSVPDAQGNMVKTRIDEMSAEQVELMAQSILKGSAEFQSYLASEAQLGNKDAALEEANNALLFAVNKYAFRDIDESISKLNMADLSDQIIDSGEINYTELFPSGPSLKDPTDKTKTGGYESNFQITGAGLGGYDVTPKERQRSQKQIEEEKQREHRLQKSLDLVNEKRTEQGLAAYSLDEYVNTTTNDSFNPYTPITSKSQRANLADQFFDPKTGGGSIVNTMVIPSLSAKHVTPGVPIASKDYFEKELDIDLTDRDELKELRGGATIQGHVGPLNSHVASGYLASANGQSFIIKRVAKKDDQDAHTLYNLAKENGYGKHKISVPQADGTFNIQEVEYFWNPDSPTGFTLIRNK